MWTGISEDVLKLSKELNQARSQAEIVAGRVSLRAEQLEQKNGIQQLAWDRFRQLNDKVIQLNLAISNLKDKQDPKQILTDLALFDTQFGSLIEEAQVLRKEARELKMSTLESNADSLAQTLQVAHQKIRSLNNDANILQ